MGRVCAVDGSVCAEVSPGDDRDVTDTVTRARQGARPYRVLAVMCVGMFLVLLDVTIVNVALPSIARSLHGDVPALQGVVDGYAIAIAGLLLSGGTLGDRFGHRRVLLLGLALFGAASVGCALAPTSGLLVAARVVQGAGGALLLPTTMAIIADVFPDRAEQARALGIWAAASSTALPAGPILGGLLVGAAGWRWVFWINIPIVVATALAAQRTVPRVQRPRTGRFDLAGTAALALGLAGLVFTVIEAGRGTGPLVLVAAATATAVAFAAAIRIERKATDPVLPLDLLRRPAFLSPNVVAGTMNLIFNGTLFVATLYLQQIRGDSPVVAGLLVLPLAVPLIALAPVSGRLTATRGPRTAVTLGCAVAATGPPFLVGLTADGGIGWLITAFVLLGCGAGLVTASVVAAVVRATPADRSGLATGVSNTARQAGTAAGVAVFGAIAGNPGDAARFVSAWHGLALAATALWLLAAGVAAVGIEHARG
jgi:DHA2 family methylenomycin A resistance protein-like MFS transporter